MQQFNVEKQGSIKASNWNARQLALSPCLGVITLANAAEQAAGLSQAMRVRSVKAFPDYHPKHLFEPHTSPEAKRTLRIKGTCGTLTVREVQTVNGLVQNFVFTKSSDLLETAWMLRFESEAEMLKAVQVFNRMANVTSPQLSRETTEKSFQAVSVA